jgi:hypothetical protein
MKKYCPSSEENICIKFKSELKNIGIRCDVYRAARIKSYLQWKCANELKLDNVAKYRGLGRTFERENSSLPHVNPEDDLLPEHIRPFSYKVWLWIKKEPTVIGNVTIEVNVTG